MDHLLQPKEYLFRCPLCQSITYIELKTESEMNNLRENNLVVDCECGGEAVPLLD